MGKNKASKEFEGKEILKDNFQIEKKNEGSELEKKANEFLNQPLPKGSYTRCPLTNRICDGRTCVLWLDASKSELNLISKMCLLRSFLKNET